MASFNGKIPEIPGIAVDNFETPGKRAYFLSHCHADHITGLKEFSKSLSSNPAFIYMSDVSAAIVEAHHDDYGALKEFTRPLIGCSTITLPADEKEGLEEAYLEVTIIPAGHCFGSVMFRFNFNSKTILYTGDFRITENSVSKLAQLHSDNKPIKLDVMYVDTTFQDKEHETFPKRADIIVDLIREIEKWLALGSEYKVGLEISARYGYEFIYKKINKQMNTNVYVSKENWKLYRQFLDRLPGVTNDEKSTRIHLCSKQSKKFCDVCCGVEHETTLYIHFSAFTWKNYDHDQTAIKPKKYKNKISVCFATHCSRSELIYFVQYLNPRRIIGFKEPYEYIPVEESSVERSPSVIKTPFKRETPRKDTPSKKPKKVDKEVLKKLFF